MTELVTLTRAYKFSAAHRLYIKALSDEENERIFNSCSNVHGHGHDYSVQIKVSGEIDPETGMVINLEELDSLSGEVLEGLDHKRLDIEVPYFTEKQPTSENIAKYVWNKLKEGLGESLVYVRVSETKNSYFEYFEEASYLDEY